MRVHYSQQLLIASEGPKKKWIGNVPSPRNHLHETRTKSHGYSHVQIPISCHFSRWNFCISHACNLTTIMNKCITKRVQSYCVS